MTYLYLFIALIIGVILGAIIVAFMVGRSDPFDVDVAEEAADTELLDFLDQSGGSLFFNKSVGDGSWGRMDDADKLVSVGKNVRQAIRGAQLKQAADAANELNTTAQEVMS